MDNKGCHGLWELSLNILLMAERLSIPFRQKARMWLVLPPVAKINTSILYPSWKLG